MLKSKKIGLFQILQNFKILMTMLILLILLNAWWLQRHSTFWEVEYRAPDRNLSTFNLGTGFHQVDKTDVEWVSISIDLMNHLDWQKSYNKIRLSRLSQYVNMGYDVLSHITPILPLHQMWFNSGVELENSCVCFFSFIWLGWVNFRRK